MKCLLFLLLSFSCFAANAQYFYNDIISTEETNKLMKSYKANNVRTVSATGVDKNGAKATDFSEFQEVKENGTALKSSSFNNMNKSVVYSRFDNQGRLISLTDSSSTVRSVITYSYDDAGKISSIENIVTDAANDFNQTETHKWSYNAAGKPSSMWRIISSAGNSDSLEICFVTDEDGNAGEERTFRKGVETGYLYYYYDDKNRLTDVVRYNAKLKKLLPDLMFEYNESDRVVQKITPTSSLTLGYLIWRYVFDDKGLKTKEALFNDDKQLTGRIDYSYTFSQ